MTVDGRLGRIAVVVLGLIAFGGAVAWFGMVRPHMRDAPQPIAFAPKLQVGTQAARDKTAAESGQPAAPSFDVVRVEPSGETVIAGRGAPGAAIELLRDGKSYFRDVADASGLFALVPPPLPPGSHDIVLQATAPDGTRLLSRQSVTVVIDAKRRRQPLVTLTSPDRPTVVLSRPQPDAEMAAAPASVPAAAAGAAVAPKAAGAPPPGARQAVKIVTVEAEDGGRLFVSGNAAPGATVRLYLNETFIAPGGAGADGALSFAIGRGVRPGDYRVRLDDVDPASGDVRSRAEVNFNVPATLAVAAGQAPAGGPAGHGGAAPQTAAAVRAQPAGATAPGVGSNAPPAATASLAGVPPAAPASAVVVPEVSTTMVGRGDNLWRISKRVYGQGTRYTVIYDANQAQIRNPRFIYPGQVFVVPPERPR
ncbi:MAG TPA: LysM peptidoglycan-binding domain-containing protein [Beijerinckiaceae bacterium]|nr:LysM peptidoglycan-binding domain-containing protein [Beijerinckiaceae bacterium]